MKNKLVLLLAATLGLAHGSMKASAVDAPEGIAGAQPPMRDSGGGSGDQELLLQDGAGPSQGSTSPIGSPSSDMGGWGFMPPLSRVSVGAGVRTVSGPITIVEGVAGTPTEGVSVPGYYINRVFVPKASLEDFVQRANSEATSKGTGEPPKTLDGFIRDLADPTTDVSPSVQTFLGEQGISVPNADGILLHPRTPSKLSAFKGLMTNSWETARNKAKRDWNSFADGYVANWNDSDISKKRKTARLGTRAARDVIHAANAANFIAELAGDRNMVLDGLNVNKKLAQDKNFAWLRSGKSKSARALRVLISFAQAGLLGTLNQLALGKLVKMADAEPSAEKGEGEHQEALDQKDDKGAL